MTSYHQNLALCLLVVTVGAGLTGCATLPHGPAPRDSPAASLSGVIATGTLISVQTSDPISGTVTVVGNPSNHALTVKLAGLAGNLSNASTAELSAAAVKPGATCPPAGLAFSNGSMSTTSNQHFTLPSDHSPGWENPSFFHSVILTSKAVPTTGGCVSGMVAYAALTWTVGDPRPDIHVIDRGPRAGARGHVVTVGGKATAYTVVAGDNLVSIAARFNLTLDDLFYLNPARTPSPLSTVTEVGETLNLSKSSR
jgi:hypothetical protein